MDGLQDDRGSLDTPFHVATPQLPDLDRPGQTPAAQGPPARTGTRRPSPMPSTPRDRGSGPDSLEGQV